MGDKTKNLLIGLFVIAGSALLIGMILFLRPTVGDMKKTLYARFSNINQISIGTRLLYAGKPVGELVAITPLVNPSRDKYDLLGRLYVYQLTMKYDSHVDIYNTDIITVQTSGLLGEKSISIIPQKANPGVVPQLIGNEPVYAVSVDPIEGILDEISDVSVKIQDTVEKIGVWFDDNAEQLSTTIGAVGGAMIAAEKMLGDINEKQIIAAVNTLITQTTETTRHVNSAFVEMENSQLFENAGVAFNNMKRASFSIEKFTRDLAIGKGTLGKLIEQDDLYLEFSSVLGKAGTMMNDINHYGVLFHLNKSWQRERLQRATLLTKLQTPYDFRQYFDCEVDTITTAMGRIGSVLDKAGRKPNEELMQSPAFKKDFRELMNRVDKLHAELKLYNEKLVEVQKSEDNCPKKANPCK